MIFLESASSNPFRNIEKSTEEFLSNTIFAPDRITSSSTLQTQPSYTTMQRKGRFSITTESQRPPCLLQQANSTIKAGDTTEAAAVAATAAPTRMSEASLDTTPSDGSNSSMSSAVNSYLDGMSDGLTSDLNSICSSPVSISSSADTRTISAVISPVDTPARSPLSSPKNSLHSTTAFKPLAPAAVGGDSSPLGSVVQVASSGRFTVTTTSPMTPSDALTVDGNPSSKPDAAAGAAAAAGTTSAAGTDLVSVLVTASSLTKKRTAVIFVSIPTAATGANTTDAAGSVTNGPTRRYRPLPTAHHPVTYKAGRFTVTEAVLFGPHWPYPEQPLKQMAAAAASATARRLAERDSSRQTVSSELNTHQAAATAATSDATAAAATAAVSAAGVQQSEAVTAEVIIARGNEAAGGKSKGLAWVRKVFGKHG
jgi:hypothetical protein